MKHLSDGQLRAHLDGELAVDEARHLAECPDCRTRSDGLAAQRAAVAARLAALTPPHDPPSAARPAWARFQRQFIQQEKVSMFTRLFRPAFRPVWATLSVVAVLVVSLSFEPVRAWAGQALGLFRVSQVTVLPINVDGTRLSELSGDSALGKQLSQLLSSSVTVSQKPGQPQPVAGAAEAAAAAHFTVRLPGNRSDLSQITVQGGSAFQFVVDRARAQALLDEAGHSDLQLPASLDGATIKVAIPAGVTATYGDCPKLAADTPTTGSQGRRYINCVFLAQIPSPTVDTPPDVDLAQLAQIGLEFTGMTPDQAKAYSQTVDWTSTLVVPIPRNGAAYQEVTVDNGAKGYLIQRPPDDAPQYALVWVKDGVIYAIGGFGTNTDAALAMANSLAAAK